MKEKALDLVNFGLYLKNEWGPGVGRRRTSGMVLKGGLRQISLAVLEGPCQKNHGIRERNNGMAFKKK